jgi:acyl carrier protein
VRPRDEVLGSLRGWLQGREGWVGDLVLEDDTDIIETRALDSLDLVEFILFLERESGRSILVETLDPRQLRTLAAIYATFFEERA